MAKVVEQYGSTDGMITLVKLSKRLLAPWTSGNHVNRTEKESKTRSSFLRPMLSLTPQCVSDPAQCK